MEFPNLQYNNVDILIEVLISCRQQTIRQSSYIKLHFYSKILEAINIHHETNFKYLLSITQEYIKEERYNCFF